MYRRSNSAELKKKKIHCLIKQQHLILTKGCGAKKCKNERCVSSGKAVPMDPNSAAKVALEYVSKEKSPIPDVLDAHTIYSLIKHSSGPLYELLIPLLKATISDPYKLSKSFTQVQFYMIFRPNGFVQILLTSHLGQPTTRNCHNR